MDQKLSPDVRPRYRGAGVGQVLGPSTIDLWPLFVGERELSLRLADGKALPKNHRKFSAIAGRKFQELGKCVGFDAVILSRGVSCRNRPVRWLGTPVAHGRPRLITSVMASIFSAASP